MCSQIIGSYNLHFHPGFGTDFVGLYGHLARLGVATLGLYLMRHTHTWNRRAKFWILYLTLLSVGITLFATFRDFANLTIDLWYIQVLYISALVGFTTFAWVKKSTAAIRAGLGLIWVSNVVVVGSFFPTSTYEVQEEECGAILKARAFKTHFIELSEVISVFGASLPVEAKYMCPHIPTPSPSSYGRVYHGPYTITQASGDVLTGHFNMGVPSGELVACTVENEPIEF